MNQERYEPEGKGKDLTMTIRTLYSTRVRQSALAVLAAGLLVAGAVIGGSAADSRTTGAPAAAAVQGAAPATMRDSYADVVAIAAPAVVTIRTEGRARVSPTGFDDDDPLRRFFGDPFGLPGLPAPPDAPRGPRGFRQSGLGSGVIVTSDGYILTNHHVVDSAKDIKVDLHDGRTLSATMIGSDRPSDLALLKVDATGLPVLPLGDSDAVRVGDVVLAVGNPLGIGQTVTMGIVSAKGRSTGVSDGSYEDFLQIDAPINRGNSGGALVSTRGELIGINSQIISTSEGNIGIGFAIPANMARHVMQELRADGRVRRARLGVTVQPVTSDLAESLGLTDVRGAIVNSVEQGSAAEKAGVRRGDVIVAFNGEAVRDTNTLRNRVADAKPGSSAPLIVVRDGRERTLTVELDEAQAPRSAAQAAESEGEQARLGVTVAPLTPELSARAGLPRDTKGLLVQAVDPDGRAAQAGIRAGDVIQEANRSAVTTVADLRAAVRTSSDRPVLLLVSRDGQERFVTVRPAES
jgi:Do/DeqQ family serine protease